MIDGTTQSGSSGIGLYINIGGVAQAFASTLQQSRGFGSEFRFPDRPGNAPGATTAAGKA